MILVDATAMNAARERLRPRIEQSQGVEITDIDLRVAAMARALRQHVRMNASWNAGSIRINQDVNVALIMAVENAVVTGIIRDADRATVGDVTLIELTEARRYGSVASSAQKVRMEVRAMAQLSGVGDAPRTKDGKADLTARAPRTRDGRPDLSGLWSSRLLKK